MFLPVLLGISFRRSLLALMLLCISPHNAERPVNTKLLTGYRQRLARRAINREYLIQHNAHALGEKTRKLCVRPKQKHSAEMHTHDRERARRGSPMLEDE